jgi:hypothetical protein
MVAVKRPAARVALPVEQEGRAAESTAPAAAASTAPEASAGALDGADAQRAPVRSAGASRGARAFEQALEARRRHTDDAASLLLRARLDDTLKAGVALAVSPFAPPGAARPSAAASRPSGAPFTPVTPERLADLKAKVDASGDRRMVDQVDNFRQTLTPELQAEYDRQLEALRQDPRIAFSFVDGATPSVMHEELALRGLLASTFGNPSALEGLLARASAGGQPMPVIFSDGPVQIGRYHPGYEGVASGLALPEPGGVAIDVQALMSLTAAGDNPFVHEFAHLAQRSPADHLLGVSGGRFPGDFPFADRLDSAFREPAFQEFLVQRFFGGQPPLDASGRPISPVHGGIETWPTLVNLYRQYPEQLRRESPEIYRTMSEYFGYDPIARTRTPPVQLNGSGRLDQAAATLLAHFDRLGLPAQQLRSADLVRLLTQSGPELPAEVRAAAALLLSSPVSRRALDVAAGGRAVDGIIERRDLEALARRLANGESLPRIIADTAAGKGGPDGRVSFEDLVALAQDPSTRSPRARLVRPAPRVM